MHNLGYASHIKYTLTHYDKRTRSHFKYIYCYYRGGGPTFISAISRYSYNGSEIALSDKTFIYTKSGQNHFATSKTNNY